MNLEKHNAKFKRKLLKKIERSIKHHNFEFQMVFNPKEKSNIKFIDKAVSELNAEIEQNGYVVEVKYRNTRSMTTNFLYKMVATFRVDIVSEDDIRFNKMINRAEGDVKW